MEPVSGALKRKQPSSEVEQQQEHSAAKRLKTSPSSASRPEEPTVVVKLPKGGSFALVDIEKPTKADFAKLPPTSVKRAAALKQKRPSTPRHRGVGSDLEQSDPEQDDEGEISSWSGADSDDDDNEDGASAEEDQSDDSDSTIAATADADGDVTMTSNATNKSGASAGAGSGSDVSAAGTKPTATTKVHTQNRWSPAEVELLARLVEEHGRSAQPIAKEWVRHVDAAKSIRTRTWSMIYEKVCRQQRRRDRRKQEECKVGGPSSKSSWTVAEKRLLKQLLDKHQRNWTSIAEEWTKCLVSQGAKQDMILSRTAHQIANKWTHRKNDTALVALLGEVTEVAGKDGKEAGTKKIIETSSKVDAAPAKKTSVDSLAKVDASPQSSGSTDFRQLSAIASVVEAKGAGAGSGVLSAVKQPNMGSSATSPSQSADRSVTQDVAAAVATAKAYPDVRSATTAASAACGVNAPFRSVTVADPAAVIAPISFADLSFIKSARLGAPGAGAGSGSGLFSIQQAHPCVVASKGSLLLPVIKESTSTLPTVAPGAASAAATPSVHIRPVVGSGSRLSPLSPPAELERPFDIQLASPVGVGAIVEAGASAAAISSNLSPWEEQLRVLGERAKDAHTVLAEAKKIGAKTDEAFENKRIQSDKHAAAMRAEQEWGTLPGNHPDKTLERYTRLIASIQVAADAGKQAMLGFVQSAQSYEQAMNRVSDSKASFLQTIGALTLAVFP